MSTLSWPEPGRRELRSDDGSLSIERSGTNSVLVVLSGALSLAHARALTEFTEACIDVAPVNLSLFQDLSQVTSVAFPAQSHLANWAREKALCFDRLHFIVHDPRLVTLVRAMFMALPVRAYLHKYRASFDASRARLG